MLELHSDFGESFDTIDNIYLYIKMKQIPALRCCGISNALSLQQERLGGQGKIGIKCFSRFLLVAHGRKPSKPPFHGPIRQRISEEDRRNV